MTETSEWAEPDAVLSGLVKSVNARQEQKSAVSLTLLADGALVSGSLIPAWEWMAEMSGGGDNWFAEIRDRQLAENAIIAEAMEKDPAERSVTEDELMAADPIHLHLRGARVFLGAHEMPKSLWRIRLARVTGWVEGELNYSQV